MLPHALGLAVVVAFGIGIVTFIGPCAPARLSSIRSTARNELRDALLYAGATAAGFATLGAVGSYLFAAVFMLSPYMYAALGIIAIVGGVRELYGLGAHTHDERNASSPNPWTAVAAGYASAWTLAPCCTPVVTAAIGIAASPVQAALVLGAFGFGHALPIIGLQRIASFATQPRVRELVTFTTGGLGIAIGLYYLILA